MAVVTAIVMATAIMIMAITTPGTTAKIHADRRAIGRAGLVIAIVVAGIKTQADTNLRLRCRRSSND